MEKEDKNQSPSKAQETENDLLLQWGNRKRLRMRCLRVKDPDVSGKLGAGIRMKITSQFLVTSSRNSERTALKSDLNENRKSPSPEKDERCYTTRGSAGLDENGKVQLGVHTNGGEDRDGGMSWPKLYTTLSSKEKEEDFLAMKGCKPPQRPRKRAKIIQRSLLLVSPGAWLTDMSQDRYEVREKKSIKKRTRGLKSMGGSAESGGSE